MFLAVAGSYRQISIDPLSRWVYRSTMRLSLRPELKDSDGNTPCPRGGTAFLLIYNAVKHQDGLIAGRLHERGAHCAIGSYFDDNANAALPYEVIDEVALVNDSIRGTPKQRRALVLRWLRWKLRQVGMPGFRAAKQLAAQ